MIVLASTFPFISLSPPVREPVTTLAVLDTQGWRSFLFCRATGSCWTPSPPSSFSVSSQHHHADDSSSALKGQVLVSLKNMLSRAGSDANTRLRRSKSAASVKKHRTGHSTQEPIDPETARCHALTAANIAMDRAKERSSAEIRRSAELSRHDSNACGADNQDAHRGQNVYFSGAAELRRQRSILQTRASNMASTLDVPTDNSYSNISHYAAPESTQFGTLDGYGSLPSSYRRLRKAKSVLTPNQRTISLHNMSSCSPASARTLRNVKSSIGEAEQGLKLGLKRSISFLRGSSNNLSKAFKREEPQTRHNDEAIQLAQEQFLNELEMQRLKKKSSFLFSAKARHQQKAFRKTVRSNKTTEFGDGVKSEDQNVVHPKSESKARSLSASLRDRFKRAFGKTTKDKFPTQQLDASRPHFRDYVDGSGNEGNLDQYFIGEEDPTARGSLYIPSDHDCRSLEDLDRMSTTLRSAQSMESLHSNSRSRVTSWTNTTMSNSLGGRNTPLEHKRLSIIKEDGGPHQPSSSVGRHKGGLEVFREPLPPQMYGRSEEPRIDPQRLYSALTKRIDQEQADAESLHNSVASSNNTPNNLPTNARNYKTTPTVRAVPSEASLYTIAPDNEHRQFSIGAPSWHEDSGMTPQQLAHHNENVERRKSQLALQEEQSSFFPFSDRSKPPKPSPFKLALRARKENQDTSDSESGSVIVKRSREPVHQVHGSYGMSDESMYSRTTGGGSNPQHESAYSGPDDLDGSPPVGGMATIIPTKVNRYPRPTASLVQVHRTRSSDRGEWQSWANNQMNNLERRNSRTSVSHHREHAQINEEDTAIGGRPSTSRGLGCNKLDRRPSERTTRNQNANMATPVGLKRDTSMNDRFPLLELKEVPRNNTPKPTPTDLQRASMMGMNDENVRRGGSDLQKKSSGVLRGKKSQTSFGFKDQDENSPPVSTPGRLNVTGQQPKRKMASFATLKDLTPTSKPKLHSQNLARLSRPFDMDVPDGNRPFDSEYLGIEQPVHKAEKAGRLSVAPAHMATALTPDYAGDDEGGATALPKIEGRSGERKVMNSKRMVSNFLRSRRKIVVKEDESAGSSPAFV